MALKLFPIPLPIFSPSPNPNPNLNPNLLLQPHPRPATEIHFSRWNNASFREYNERRRVQKEIEDDIRRNRRFNSATNIIDNYDPATANLTHETNNNVKSIGTPSSPSAPSIPGRKSKYSKPANSHPAFRPISKITKVPLPHEQQQPINRNADIKLSDDGLSFVVDGAPFEFKYSYTESPKIKPVKLREPPFSPFGPTTMGRPWTGRAPLPPSRKKMREFDSFKLPPPDKKGVKPVQKPGPFLPGMSPRYVYTREEILGEPLTKEEVKDLIQGCLKTKRQLNMGRDGLTHNMLDNIHAHWKRRRVCKIKCLGVCTVDMDNVCLQLEERTGGKVISRKGGVVFLFRGRNYNYRTRPRFPLMLWKPVTPVYPRLIQRAPEGLTLQEATEMRKKGRTLIPICKLAKNGVYCNLVQEVREALEECELVRINCQGVNGSDYRKIGAKLKELVPCVLISFEHEHILMWRGRDWKSSLTKPVNDCDEANGADADSGIFGAPVLEDPIIEVVSHEDNLSEPNMSPIPVGIDVQAEGTSMLQIDGTYLAMDSSSTTRERCETYSTVEKAASSAVSESEVISNAVGNEANLQDLGCAKEMPMAMSVVSDTILESVESEAELSEAELRDASEDMIDLSKPTNLNMSYADGVLQLQEQAIESGIAVVLDDADLDADIVYQRAVAFGKSAPPGPLFRHRPKKASIQKSEKQESNDLQAQEFLELKHMGTTVSQTKGSERSSRPQRNKKFRERSLDSAPRGSLGVEELAKLLAYH